jgi:FKBP-type peptidyl-prolyl cis-trans isomerase SlyD
MDKIKKNTLVSLFIKLEDNEGTLFDESEELMYLHGGYGQIFQKLEEELEGKKVGDAFCVALTPKEAFGEYDDSLVLKEMLEDLPEDIAVGMELEGEDESKVYIVESMDETYAILNGNHELAGIPIVVSGKVLDTQQLSETAAQELLDAQEDHHH